VLSDSRERVIFYANKYVGLPMHDVIVVGAGPSGSFAAMKCAEYGLDVLLLDSEKFPRDKACGGVIGEKGIELIGGDVMSVVECEGTGNDFFYDWKYIGSLGTHQYFVKRRRFDHYMVGKAVAAGAEFMEGIKATCLGISSDKTVVRTTAGDFVSNIVVAADGINSTIGRSIGLSHYDDICRYASIKAEVDVSHAKGRDLGVEDPNRQRTYFFSDLLGFAWVVPNNGSVNVGYGSTVSKANDLKARFHLFLAKLALAPQFERGAQIPFMTTKRVYAERVLLTGDAGGFVNPWTGCGIDEGIAASEKAALICKKAVDAQEYSPAILSSYQEICRESIRRISRRGRWIKALDRLVPKGAGLPFWTEYLVRRLRGIA